MNVWQALHTFWSGFGLPAFDESIVPNETTVDGTLNMPYITYSAGDGVFESPFPLTGTLWYRGESWTDISLKAEAIREAIGISLLIAIDGGYLFICPGNPFSYRVADSDPAVRRVNINIMVELYRA